MPIAVGSPPRNSGHSSVTAAGQAPGKPETREAAQLLTKLLTCAPVDLSGISDEIRRHPDLESLILRPGALLAPSPDEPLSTVEEAVVVLGTSRLRALIDQWSSTNPVDRGLLQSQQNGASS